MIEPNFCPQCRSELSVSLRDGIERLICSDQKCEYVFWGNPTPVVAAIVEIDHKVVLVRNKGWPEKWYGLVSGFLERSETPEDGVLREVAEELGLEAEIRDFIGLYTFEQRNELIIAYHLAASGSIILGEELEDFKLIPREKLRPWSFGTGLAVSDWLARQSVK